MGFLHKFKKIYFWVYLVWPIIKNFFPKIKVLSSIETLEKIRKTNCSCVRLGDGEFGILKGVGGPGYQKMSVHLRKALLEVLTNTMCTRAFRHRKNDSVYETRALSLDSHHL